MALKAPANMPAFPTLDRQVEGLGACATEGFAI